MSFDLLSDPIKRYVRDKRWEELRPIQNAAISRILSTSDNYILASRTASGKTEAAFLPILSQVNFADRGVQVLYISPLIALINDQFYRVEELCKYLDVSVTKWHGEAKQSAKQKLLKEPNGIVLITPESLEAMLVNKPYNIKHLFSDLKFVVIDEIHAFLGTDRGIQLKSILSRIHAECRIPFRIIALSATIGDYTEAKNFLSSKPDTKVLLDKTAKEVEVNFRYFESTKPEVTEDLIENLFLEVADNKVLIFPNSRGRAEEIAVKLKKLAEKRGLHANYFSHHSSVDKEVREYVEHFAKTNKRDNFCITCTSTLELGIDIGTVDEVVQIDSTNSISSLIQRIGRSGRKDGAPSRLILYATNEWSLLQSLACWLLYKEGFIEPPSVRHKPYDILLHQALSIVKGHSGIQVTTLIQALRSNLAFQEIAENEIQEILEHLLQNDLFEKIGEEIILGLAGEGIVNNRDFYSVFKSEETFKIINKGNTIGELPYSPQLQPDQNILLAAQKWKIVYVDLKSHKIEVIKTHDGKAPIFGGESRDIHPSIRNKMLELLYTENTFDFLDERGTEKLQELTKEFSCFSMKDNAIDRPLKISETHLEFYTFSGTRINRAIQFLLSEVGIKSTLFDSHSYLLIEYPEEEFYLKVKLIGSVLNNLDNLLLRQLEKNPNLIAYSKWGIYLPLKYQALTIKQQYFDFESASQFLNTINFVRNSE